MLGLSRGCSATSSLSLSRIRPPQRRAPSCLSLCRARAHDADEDFYGDSLLAGEYGARILVPSYDEDNKEFGEIKLECDDSGCVLVVPKTKSLGEDDTSGHLQCNLTGCYFTDDLPKENGFEVIKGQKWCLGYETAPESEESFSAVIGAGGWSIALTASEFNDFCQLIQTLRKGIATMDEDGFIGKDDISMQVEKGSLWMECTIPKKRVAILQNFWKLGNWGLLDNQQTSAFELRFVISGSGRRQVTCNCSTCSLRAKYIFILLTRHIQLLRKIGWQRLCFHVVRSFSSLLAEGFWPAEAVMDMLKKIDAINSEQSRAFESGL